MNLQKIAIQGTLELQWSVSWGARCCRWRVTLRKGQPHTNSAALTVLACSVAQSCLTLCDPMDCNLPGFSAHGILQSRILKWVAIPFSSESSWLRDQTQVSCIAVGLFTFWATRETLLKLYWWWNRAAHQPPLPSPVGSCQYLAFPMNFLYLQPSSSLYPFCSSQGWFFQSSSVQSNKGRVRLTTRKTMTTKSFVT